MRTMTLLALAAALAGCRAEPEDLDLDGFDYLSDCNDNDPAIFPGAEELCDGIDNDCSGDIDEEAIDAGTFYLDGDGDGSGSSATAVGCEAPEGYVTDTGDCNDSDSDVFPGAPETDCTDPTDYNCDGSSGYADADADGFPACEECDDSQASISPVATEVCDGVDNDCDGDADTGAVDAATWYADADGDGYGDPSVSSTGCEAPAGTVANADDCDDAADAIHPGMDESCNGVDDDCDGDVDDNAIDETTWYADVDNDGAFGSAVTADACTQPEGYGDAPTDCDDVDAASYPGADELCDGVDNDCDGAVPTDETDVDGDGWTACDGDCDDAEPTIYPAALEQCNDADDNCNGAVDDGVAFQDYFADVDTDGFGAGPSESLCAAPGYDHATIDGDCDDTNAGVNPDADELCDGAVDEDCDGQVDEDSAVDAADWFIDIDGDGYGSAISAGQHCAGQAGWADNSDDCRDLDEDVNPDATEVCDTIDNDCSGEVDGDEVLGLGPDCAAAHCSDLNDVVSGLDDGVYWIDSTGRTLPYEAYCDMTTDGGGWTLALKADGRQTTFVYSSALWTNSTLLNEGDVSIERTEAKYESFVSTPFNEVMVGIESPIAGSGLLDLETLTLDHTDDSLWDTFNGGYVATSAGRDSWKGLMAGSSLQANCNREGFNVDGNGEDVRIGIINNQENDCNSPDSRLGIGGGGGNCGTIDSMAVGNTARCGSDGGDVDLYGFAAVYTRCDSSVADDSRDGIDQNCDGFDGVDADGDGWWAEADCDDDDPDVFPGDGSCLLATSCLDYLDADPGAPDGVYTIDPQASGATVDVYCDMTTDDGGWTLVYKIADQSAMKSTAAVSPGVLQTDDMSLTTSGKLDDADIRALYTEQFRSEQWLTVPGAHYCTLEDPDNYADNVRNMKRCGLTYDPSAGYTALSTNNQWTYSFGTWYTTGSIIVQLNYGDSRLGSHRTLGYSSSGDPGCTNSGGCHAQVWVR